MQGKILTMVHNFLDTGEVVFVGHSNKVFFSAENLN